MNEMIKMIFRDNNNYEVLIEFSVFFTTNYLLLTVLFTKTLDMLFRMILNINIVDTSSY